MMQYPHVRVCSPEGEGLGTKIEVVVSPDEAFDITPCIESVEFTIKANESTKVTLRCGWGVLTELRAKNGNVKIELHPEDLKYVR